MAIVFENAIPLIFCSKTARSTAYLVQIFTKLAISKVLSSTIIIYSVIYTYAYALCVLNVNAGVEVSTIHQTPPDCVPWTYYRSEDAVSGAGVGG